MRFLFLVVLLGLASCSGGGNGPASVTSSGLSESQVQAKALIAPEMKQLQTNQYQISNDDLAILEDEDLLTAEELKSITIIK